MPRIFFLALFSIAVIVILSCSAYIFETNDAGQVQIKQAAGTGTMTVHSTPGSYIQGFGDITTYQISDVYDFNDEPINVTFGDSSTAHVSGQIKYRLPVTDAQILQIHQDFKSYPALQTDLIRAVVQSVLTQTSSMFVSEEVYSTRRSDYINLINEQIKYGIYATIYTETVRRDEDNNPSLVRLVTVKRNEAGVPLVSEPSTFKRYGVELVQLVINKIEFDEQTKALIVKRKEAEQERVVSKSKAERAKQEAITAEAQGKANVATAEAEALVEKKRAVIAAEKETEVAEQVALQAAEQAKAKISLGEAEAKAAALKVSAGLTPQERAQFDKDTAIGVAGELAKVRFPEMLIIGGSGSSTASPLNPFDAVGLNSFIDISKRMSESRNSKQ